MTAARPIRCDEKLDGPGCGQSDHGSDCLCDVHITSHSPIRIAELADLPFVAGTVERLQLAVPWTANDLASVMRIVLRAHDMKQQRLSNITPRPVAVVDGDRARLLDLHSNGATITDAMTALNLTFEEWRSLLLPGRNNPMHCLSEAEWRDIETTVTSHSMSVMQLALRYQIPEKTFMDAVCWMGLHKHVTQRLREHGGPRRLSDSEREQMRDWIREGLTTTEVKRLVHEHFAVTIDRSLVSHTRARMARRGDL